MAVLADIGRLYMGAVLTRCGGTVMTGNTVTGQAGMVEIRRHPTVSGMAGLAVITALYM